MNAIVRRQRSSFVLFVAALVVTSLAAACGGGGDARTADLVPGMNRDSALKLLGRSAPGTDTGASAADTLKNIWRRTQYLMAGKNIEILFYSPNNERWKAADTVPEEKVIPVVLMEGVVIGVGRTVYDSVSRLYGIPKNVY